MTESNSPQDCICDATPEETSQPLFAFRGGKALTSEELQAHLAALIHLENVGVLLGAGCSAGAVGGMTMKQLWELFVQEYNHSFVWLKDKGFLTDELKVSVGIYNVEKLLDSLEIAQKEWQRQGKTILVKTLKTAKDDVYRSVIRAALLEKDWWTSPNLAFESDKLKPHRTLLQRITSSRQPGQCSPSIFTVNYDLAVEWAAESMGLRVMNGFDGTHYRVFSPHSFDLGLSNMLARGEARFGTYGIYLSKLHGSLSWKLASNQEDYLEVSCTQAWSGIDSFLNGSNSKKQFAPIVFPSAAKYMQTVGFVLGELFRRFTEFLSRPQTCLMIIGYSFSDDHLNLVLTRALQNPTLQIVICIPEADVVDGKLDYQKCNRWIKNLGLLELPQVTIIATPRGAYFENFVSFLPDPVIYDKYAQEIKKVLADIRRNVIDPSGNP